MSTAAQVNANQSNAQRSTGRKSAEGKAIASMNNFQHGFTGQFRVLAWEDQDEFNGLFVRLHGEHKPSTLTEDVLVDKMAQALWLSKRALLLQDLTFNVAAPTCLDEKQLSLYIRYQTTNDRAFHRCLSELLKLRAEKRKQEIGFESQERKRKEEDRKQQQDSRQEADQLRKQELHEARVRALNAKAAGLELDSDIRQTIEARLPGNTAIPFQTLKGVLKLSLEEVARDMAEKAA
jgi:hypothetical protein